MRPQGQPQGITCMKEAPPLADMAILRLLADLRSLEARTRGRNITERDEAAAILEAMEELQGTIRAAIRVRLSALRPRQPPPAG